MKIEGGLLTALARSVAQGDRIGLNRQTGTVGARRLACGGVRYADPTEYMIVNYCIRPLSLYSGNILTPVSGGSDTP
jgi:hypothetical protein